MNMTLRHESARVRILHPKFIGEQKFLLLPTEVFLGKDRHVLSHRDVLHYTWQRDDAIKCG